MRPNKLWHWFAVAFLVATFLAEPRASTALTWELFRGAGAVGGELLTGEPEPDVLNLKPPPPDHTDRDGEPVESGDQYNSAPAPDESGGAVVVQVDGGQIQGVLDHGVAGVLALHNHVQSIQQAGGFLIEIGEPS